MNQIVTLSKDQFLNESIFDLDIDSFLISGMNTGKTTSAVNIKSDDRVIIFSTSSLAIQKQAHQKNPSAKLANGSHQIDFDELSHGDFIISTNNQLFKIITEAHARGLNTYTIIDEAHNLISDASEKFQGKIGGGVSSVYRALEFISKSDSHHFCLMTATPESENFKSEFTKNIKITKVIKKDDEGVDIDLLVGDIGNKIDTIDTQIREANRLYGADCTKIIPVDSIHERYLTEIESIVNINGYQGVFYNSLSRDGQRQTEIIEGEAIEENEILVSSPALRDGASLFNGSQKARPVVILGGFIRKNFPVGVNQMIQNSKRVRDASSYHIIYSVDEDFMNQETVDFDTYYESIVKGYYAIAESQLEVAKVMANAFKKTYSAKNINSFIVDDQGLKFIQVGEDKEPFIANHIVDHYIWRERVLFQNKSFSQFRRDIENLNANITIKIHKLDESKVVDEKLLKSEYRTLYRQKKALREKIADHVIRYDTIESMDELMKLPDVKPEIRENYREIKLSILENPAIFEDPADAIRAAIVKTMLDRHKVNTLVNEIDLIARYRSDMLFKKHVDDIVAEFNDNFEINGSVKKIIPLFTNYFHNGSTSLKDQKDAAKRAKSLVKLLITFRQSCSNGKRYMKAEVRTIPSWYEDIPELLKNVA